MARILPSFSRLIFLFNVIIPGQSPRRPGCCLCPAPYHVRPSHSWLYPAHCPQRRRLQASSPGPLSEILYRAASPAPVPQAPACSRSTSTPQKLCCVWCCQSLSPCNQSFCKETSAGGPESRHSSCTTPCQFSPSHFAQTQFLVSQDL